MSQQQHTDEELIEELESRGYNLAKDDGFRFVRKVQALSHERRMEQFPELEMMLKMNPEFPPFLQLAGALSELGELAQEDVKGLTYDSWENSDEAKQKELGDVFVYLMGYASFRGYDVDECIEMAADDFIEVDRN